MRRFTGLAISLIIGSQLLTGCAGGPTGPTPIGSAQPTTTTPAAMPPDASPARPQSDAASPVAATGAASTADGARVTENAVRIPARYVVLAVSGGLDGYRNDAWAYRWGTDYNYLLGATLSDCQRNGGGMCGHEAVCGPADGLSVNRPFFAFARSSVFSRNFLDRGATGVACGYSSANAAANAAVSQCRIHGCRLLVADRVY